MESQDQSDAEITDNETPCDDDGCNRKNNVPKSAMDVALEKANKMITMLNQQSTRVNAQRSKMPRHKRSSAHIHFMRESFASLERHRSLLQKTVGTSKINISDLKKLMSQGAVMIKENQTIMKEARPHIAKDPVDGKADGKAGNNTNQSLEYNYS